MIFHRYKYLRNILYFDIYFNIIKNTIAEKLSLYSSREKLQFATERNSYAII